MAPRVLGAISAVGWFLLVGGAGGVAAGVAAGLAVPRVLQWRDLAAARRREEEVVGQQPLVAELLAACLAAGASTGEALQAVATAIGGTSGAVLDRAALLWRLGGDSTAVVAVLSEAGLREVALAVERSTLSGGPLVEVLEHQAAQLRADWLASATVRARSVAVKSVLPLALCYLPAFLLVGVVPIVVGLADSILPRA